MEKLHWLLASTLLSISIIVAGFFIGNMHKTGKEYDRTVEVKGLSERNVNADLAVWPLNITVTGNDLNILREQINSQKTEVNSFFKTLGFSNEELSSGSTNILDARADLYNNNQYMEFRYVAKTDFTIRTTDIKKLQNALDKSLDLVSKGILITAKNSWQPIVYTFSGLNEIKPIMIEEATKNAREVAEKFAKDSNSKVGKIRNANQGLFSIYDRDENTPHIKTVRVVSTIKYQLKD